MPCLIILWLELIANRSKRTSISAIKTTAIIIILIGVVAVAELVFTGAETDNYKEKNKLKPKTIEAVLKKHTAKLMSIPGVVGTAQGICDDKACIKIFVIEKTPALTQQVPKFIEGFPVDLEESGEIRAYPRKELNH
jgi:hypothetical protein